MAVVFGHRAEENAREVANEVRDIVNCHGGASERRVGRGVGGVNCRAERVPRPPRWLAFGLGVLQTLRRTEDDVALALALALALTLALALALVPTLTLTLTLTPTPTLAMAHRRRCSPSRRQRSTRP